ncbi:uncharacterized protein DUF3857 [Larkinella arboricola]|uniref:Uncharacterized protein DUF3857 n=1 Tax=Larkinella arboricola TaxID=643671 RepID=A0A327WX06_LARAB|nr:DUF3857 domain-containing protein [Larkinella arboricola]RAJ97837.1 uncharacterized protein DUF3857 [Larkinella arboricola]
MIFFRFVRRGLAFAFSFISFYAVCQTDKFGHVDPEDLKMKVYPADSSADAVVLSDIGKSYITQNDTRGYYVYYERHVRVKILKKSAFEQATVIIPFHNIRVDLQEQVSGIEGITYNLSPDGSFTTDRLTKDAIFEERRTENIYVKRFTLPNVREGSIIEFKYTITSDFVFELREWDFQKEIPVRWSQYDLTLIPGFEYRILFQGFEALAVDKSERLGNDIHYRWVMKNLSALREEDFMATPDNYRAKVWFELIRTSLPHQVGPQSYAKKWEDLDKFLLGDSQFGLAVNRTGFLKEVASSLQKQSTDTLQRVTAAYKFIRQVMTWNRQRGIWAKNSLKNAFETKTGNVAELNLMLVGLLREMGLEAYPVILSTKQNGLLSKEYPLLTRFDYVVAAVPWQGKDLLLDACESGLKAGVLPVRCLNGEGRLVHSRRPRWIPLTPTEKRREAGQFMLAVSKDAQLDGTISITHSGYAAADSRQHLHEVSLEKFRQAVKSRNPDWQWSELNVQNADSSDLPLTIKGTVTVSEAVSRIENRLFLRPLPISDLMQNPFKAPERRFPVDMGVPIEKSYAAIYTLPEGYVVEEVPKNVALVLPGNAGRFTFMTQMNGNSLQVVSRLTFNKAVFNPDEYGTLREFYSQVIAKHAEQVVLKKSNE